MTITVQSGPAVVAGVLLLAACLLGIGVVIGARLLSRDAVILRARRRDARRLARARARVILRARRRDAERRGVAP